MAFKPRKQNIDSSHKNNGIEKVDDVGFAVDTTKNPNTKFITERKTWKDESIEILNILDSQGINIYDESRTPGMYINGNKKPVNSIIKFLGSKNNQDQQKQRNTENNIPKDLFSHLISKNK